MDTRIALVGIMVENPDAAPAMNQILHEYADFIIGRMGIPYRKHKICIVSIVLDAPDSVISAVSGKLGMIPGLSVKTLYAKQKTMEAEA